MSFLSSFLCFSASLYSFHAFLFLRPFFSNILFTFCVLLSFRPIFCFLAFCFPLLFFFPPLFLLFLIPFSFNILFSLFHPVFYCPFILPFVSDVIRHYSNISTDITTRSRRTSCLPTIHLANWVTTYMCSYKGLDFHECSDAFVSLFMVTAEEYGARETLFDWVAVRN